MNKYIKIIQCEGHKCEECGHDKNVAMVKSKTDTRTDKRYLCTRCISETIEVLYDEVISDEKET